MRIISRQAGLLLLGSVIFQPIPLVNAMAQQTTTAAKPPSVADQRNAALALIRGKDVAKDVAAGMSQLEGLADKDRSAKLELANILMAGVDVPKDQTRAFRLYFDLSATNLPQAYTALGNAFLTGSGVAADAKLARDNFDRAIALNDIVAKRKLGEVLIKGQGLPQDKTRGLALLEEAAKTDDGSKLLLANLLLAGTDIAGDKPRALQSLNDLAAKGSIGASESLGYAYLAGKLLPADPALARANLDKAASLGSIAAKRKTAEALIKGQGLPKDAAQGLPMLEEVAAKNDGAKLILANLLLEGKDLPQDAGRALTLLESLSKSGNTAAINALANAYLAGTGVTADAMVARNYLDHAVALNDATAKRTLAQALIRGKGLAKDVSQGLPLLEDAAKTDQSAALMLGNMLLAGTDIPADKTRGLQLLNDLAGKGSVGANEALGMAFLAGTSVPADAGLARANLEKAAQLGSSFAKRKMAEALIKGQGLPQDVEQGLPMLEEAALVDNGAKLILANLLLEGKFLPKKEKRAFDLLNGLAEANDVGALNALATVYLKGNDAKANPDLARRYLDRAIALNDVNAKRILAEALIRGQGLSKDLAQGSALLESAATTDVSAKILLANLLLTGAELPRDQSRALKILNELADTGNVAALTALAQASLAGQISGVDAKTTRTLLDRAVSLNSVSAKRKLGEALIKGQGLPRDVPSGLAMLEDAAKTDVGSNLLLVNFYVNKLFVTQNIVKAEKFAQDALKLGSASGFVTLGNYYVSLPSSALNGKKAEDHLLRAARNGEGSAWVVMANGIIFKKISQPTVSLATCLKKAKEAKAYDGEVIAASRYLWAAGVPRDLRRYQTLLAKAASEGNPSAARALARVYRNGIPNLMGGNLIKAEAVLKQYAGVFGPEKLRNERLLLDAAKLSTPKAYAKFWDDPASAALAVQGSVIGDLYTTNKHLVVFQAGRNLKAKGIYKGEASGLLTKSMIGALNKACIAGSGEKTCKRPVTSAEFLGYIITNWRAA